MPIKSKVDSVINFLQMVSFTLTLPPLCAPTHLGSIASRHPRRSPTNDRPTSDRGRERSN
jgi:hypothetical protein